MFTIIKEKAFLMLIFSGAYFSALSQNKKMEDKIDPVFRNMINTSNVKACKVTSNASLHSTTKKRLTFSDTATIRKKYDCIVYTEKANVLRKKGIVINSVLPTFVTASANLCQIIQMSAMTEVTKIEAPRAEKMH